MRLFASPTSPYARKVRAVLIEKQLEDAVEMVDTNPLADPPELRAANPLGKVPTLALSDGRALFDSPVICTFLDEIGSGPRLIPSNPRRRLDLMVRQALADGVMDAAFALVMEQRRPRGQQSRDWIVRWTAAILKGTADMALRAGRHVDLGDIASACALGYLDFRLPAIDWRAGSPALSIWYAGISTRPSLARTAPPAEVAR